MPYHTTCSASSDHVPEHNMPDLQRYSLQAWPLDRLWALKMHLFPCQRLSPAAHHSPGQSILHPHPELLVLASTVGAGHSYSGCGSYGGREPCQLEAVLQACHMVVPRLHTCLPGHCLPLLARCDGLWSQVA